MYDEKMLGIIAENPNMMVPWYLMASYLYYICDESLLSDTMFDGLCKRLLVEWDNIKHFNKKVINVNDLHAGTCMLKERDFPNRVKSAAKLLINPKKYQAKPDLIPESLGLLSFFN